MTDYYKCSIDEDMSISLPANYFAGFRLGGAPDNMVAIFVTREDRDSWVKHEREESGWPYACPVGYFDRVPLSEADVCQRLDISDIDDIWETVIQLDDDYPNMKWAISV